MKKVIVGLVVVAAAVVGFLTWRNSRPQPFIVSGFIEADQIRVGSRVGGRVSKVHVEEGDSVRPGDPLFEIDPFDLQAQHAEAQADLAAARAEYDRLKAGYRVEEIAQAGAKRDAAAAQLDVLTAGPRKQEIESARAELDRAKANLDMASAEFARISRLKEQSGVAAEKEYDEATRGNKAAQAEVDAATQKLSLLEEGSRKEDIARARAQLAEADAALALLTQGYRKEDIDKAASQVQAAEARVKTIEARVEELLVKSPCGCKVEAIDLQAGDLVGANAPTVSLLDLSRMWVRAYVPEGRLGAVTIGDLVPVVVDSLPNERLSARLTYISQEAEFTPRNIQTPEERSKQVFRIKVWLDAESARKARVGMGANVLLGEATHE